MTLKRMQQKIVDEQKQRQRIMEQQRLAHMAQLVS
jgi:hypothetical protein